jgi:hypothetical protein
MMPVLAASEWRTNAEMIRDVARLGYLRYEIPTLDPTYGKGNWWNLWRPAKLVTSDLYTPADLAADFRRLPLPDRSFYQITFDPPYVSVGGRDTSGMKDLHEAYGLGGAPNSPAGVQGLINDGLAEMARVIEPRGFLLVKCQDYISSGKLWNGSFYTQREAERLGFTLHDRLEHIAGVRPQPPGRAQKHARRNLSTLFVFRGPK